MVGFGNFCLKTLIRIMTLVQYWDQINIPKLGSLWGGRTNPKNCACLISLKYFLWGLDHSKVELWVSVSQRTVKLQAVKDGGLKEKKFCHSARVEPLVCSPGSSPGWLDYAQSLMDCNSVALWSTETHTSFEKSKSPLVTYFLAKRLATF